MGKEVKEVVDILCEETPDALQFVEVVEENQEISKIITALYNET